MDAELRLVFVGQRAYFGYTALAAPADGVVPAFIELRPDMSASELRGAVIEADPDVVVCFRPEFVPAGALHDVDAVTIGFLTEPLPRPGHPTHPDLEQRLEYLRAVDAGNFDRTVAYDPGVAATADPILPVWRSMPIPVGDALFTDRPVSLTCGRILFTGRSTTHRDSILDPIKHHYDVVHLAHGVTDEELEPFLNSCSIGLNLHNEPYLNYENRVSVYLARGMLVLSERLSPSWGLQHGIDYVEIDGVWDAWELLRTAVRRPDAFDRLRWSGRRKAERFRASRSWPQLARAAVDDVGRQGSARRRRHGIAVRRRPARTAVRPYPH